MSLKQSSKSIDECKNLDSNLKYNKNANFNLINPKNVTSSGGVTSKCVIAFNTISYIIERTS
jgi:hypothetical protein